MLFTNTENHRRSTAKIQSENIINTKKKTIDDFFYRIYSVIISALIIRSYPIRLNSYEYYSCINSIHWLDKFWTGWFDKFKPTYGMEWSRF